MSTNGFFCDNDLRVEDFDDEETADCRVPAPLVARGVGGRPLTEDEAISLKELVFGSNPLCEEWRQQYLEFSPNVFYGLVQRKGGPCGVLAAIQAHLLVRLFFCEPDTDVRHCLAKAMADILWRAGDRKRAFVAHESRETSSRALPMDGICERLVVATLDDYDALWRHIAALLDHNARALGVLSFLFSALLTRDARQDMDDVSSRLIGRHNYCTQEMVNLLLTGRAVSNVFDNTRRLSPELLLRGIARQSRVGFLSLFEHFGCLEVGRNYKSPEFPVFVVQSESHFSVLFAKQRLEDCEDFALFHFDGLADQSSETELRVRTAQEEDTAAENVAPLEAVVRTKWRKARIDWRSERVL